MSLTEKQITKLLNFFEKEREVSEDLKRHNKYCLLEKARSMLKNWGIVNAYSSCCGYPKLDQLLNQMSAGKGDFIYVENEIILVDSYLLELKNAKDKTKQEMFAVTSLYYKGFDIVDNGNDWSERLTIRTIADQLNISKSTVFRRISSVESFIASQISEIF